MDLAIWRGSGGSAPRPPGFIASGLRSRKATGSRSPGYPDRLANLRRSGCFPAEPYPPKGWPDSSADGPGNGDFQDRQRKVLNYPVVLRMGSGHQRPLHPLLAELQMAHVNFDLCHRGPHRRRGWTKAFPTGGCSGYYREKLPWPHFPKDNNNEIWLIGKILRAIYPDLEKAGCQGGRVSSSFRPR